MLAFEPLRQVVFRAEPLPWLVLIDVIDVVGRAIDVSRVVGRSAGRLEVIPARILGPVVRRGHRDVGCHPLELVPIQALLRDEAADRAGADAHLEVAPVVGGDDGLDIENAAGLECRDDRSLAEVGLRGVGDGVAAEAVPCRRCRGLWVGPDIGGSCHNRALAAAGLAVRAVLARVLRGSTIGGFCGEAGGSVAE